VSERRVCRVSGQPRSTQRYESTGSEYEQILTDDSVRLASDFGRYWYRRITALMQLGGWKVNHKRREGLKVPGKQSKRARLWLQDCGSMMGRASGPDPKGRTTSGLTTLSW